jgi:hypothetical protein
MTPKPRRRNPAPLRAEPVGDLFEDLARCFPLDVQLAHLARDRALVLLRATWNDTRRVRWVQLLAIPSERMRRARSWFAGHVDIDDREGGTFLAFEADGAAARPVLLSAAEIVEHDVDGAQVEAERRMRAALEVPS